MAFWQKLKNNVIPNHLFTRIYVEEAWKFKETSCENLCPKLLCLENPFEFIWNLKLSFEFWKSNLNLKILYPVWYLFQTWTPQSGAMFVCTAPPQRGYIWNNFSDIEENFFRFELNFQILKLDLRFQINSNEFSRQISFGHKGHWIKNAPLKNYFIPLW